MQSKPKSWKDIEMIVSSIAVAALLGLWSLFSSGQKILSGVRAQGNLSIPPDPNAASNTPSPTRLPLLPGQVLLLNGANMTQLSTQLSTPAAAQPNPPPLTQRKSHGSGSSGGGSVTKTGSSHP